jgi:hypothetical protein
MQKAILFPALLCVALHVCAQTSTKPFKLEKWGKIPEADLKMTVYPEDSNANAVVLQDVGNLQLSYDGSEFFVQLERSRRIKIFEVSALDQGNLRIPYRSSVDEERLLDLEIQVFAPDGSKQKVKSDNIFTEKVSKKWSVKKIFIPNLQKGAVIEYRYTLRSTDYLTLYDWYFQEDIPVRWSQLQAIIPGYFDYAYLLHAPRACDLLETSHDNGSGTDGTQYPITIVRFGFGSMPALKDEPYMTTLDDYLAHIGFQLRGVNFPNERPQSIMTTWTETAVKLEENKDFGAQYLKTDQFKKLWEAFKPLIQTSENQDSIAEKALRFVSRSIKWNKEFKFWPSDKPNDIFEKKTGNSADLNLILVALLKTAGLNAAPLAISTRSNGVMYQEYPFIQQFNSVAVYYRSGSTGILLDATNPFQAFNALSPEHCNRKGWVIDRQKPEWINITPKESVETWFGDMQLSESGLASGTFNLMAAGSRATDWRADLSQTNAQSFVKKHFASNFADLKADSIVLGDLANCSKPVSLRFNCSIPNAATVANDFIYFQPVLDFIVDENPLKTLKRTFQVNFPYPIKANYILHLSIPKGYELADMPESVRIALPNDGGKLSFACSKMSDGKIEVVFKMNVQQLDYSPEEYPALRQFFELIAEKSKLQLILKKS